MRKLAEHTAYICNILSIAAYFYLLSVMDAAVHAPLLTWIGLVLFCVGLALVVASIVQLVRNRDKGLIDWGVYGWVRHPMYLGASLIFLSWSFLLPTWITVLLSLANAAICYGFMVQGDRLGAETFGVRYASYAARVPRLNLVAGAIRSLRRQ